MHPYLHFIDVGLRHVMSYFISHHCKTLRVFQTCSPRVGEFWEPSFLPGTQPLFRYPIQPFYVHMLAFNIPPIGMAMAGPVSLPPSYRTAPKCFQSNDNYTPGKFSLYMLGGSRPWISIRQFLKVENFCIRI